MAGWFTIPNGDDQLDHHLINYLLWFPYGLRPYHNYGYHSYLISNIIVAINYVSYELLGFFQTSIVRNLDEYKVKL